MPTISRTCQFKKDYKREAKGQHRATLDADLMSALSLLGSDRPLPERMREHALAGEWTDHRCHIKPDLVLIYRVPDAERLELVRLGSHSQLSL
jgi:mRNA interferase YafQ